MSDIIENPDVEENENEDINTDIGQPVEGDEVTDGEDTSDNEDEEQPEEEPKIPICSKCKYSVPLDTREICHNGFALGCTHKDNIHIDHITGEEHMMNCVIFNYYGECLKYEEPEEDIPEDEIPGDDTSEDENQNEETPEGSEGGDGNEDVTNDSTGSNSNDDVDGNGDGDSNTDGNVTDLDNESTELPVESDDQTNHI